MQACRLRLILAAAASAFAIWLTIAKPVHAAEPTSNGPDIALKELARIATDANVEAEFRSTGVTSVAELHLLSQRMQLPYVVLFVEASNGQPGRFRQASVTTGAWVGQTGERWHRTVCKLQIGAGVTEEANAMKSAVWAWTVVAPAGAIRRMASEQAGSAQLERLNLMDEERYSSRRSHAAKLLLDDIGLIAEDQLVPAGCEAYARKLKGVRVADMRVPALNSGATRLVLSQLASEMPKRPVELELTVPANARLGDITELVNKYDIAHLRVVLMWVPDPPNSANVIFRDYDFASGGGHAPPYRAQMERAVCSFRINGNNLVRPARDGLSLETVVPPRETKITVLMTASEANRLIGDLPKPIEDAKVSKLPPGFELESDHSTVAFRFAEPLHVKPGAVVPEECKSYVGAAPAGPA